MTGFFLAQPAGAAHVQPASGKQTRPQKKTRPVTLTWNAPETNTNGTPLDDLAGYRIHYGKKPHTYTEILEVGIDDADLRCSTIDESDEDEIEGAIECTYVLCGLDRGSYYFAVTAINSAGSESKPSNEIKK